MLNHRHKTPDYRNPFKKLNCKDILISCRPLNDTLTTRGVIMLNNRRRARPIISERSDCLERFLQGDSDLNNCNHLFLSKNPKNHGENENHF